MKIETWIRKIELSIERSETLTIRRHRRTEIRTEDIADTATGSEVTDLAARANSQPPKHLSKGESDQS
jgi:hypothetical protein